MPEAVWSDENIAKAAALWEEGLSASGIGDKLGVTRNAVIGVVHRNRELFRRRRLEGAKVDKEQVRPSKAISLVHRSPDKRAPAGGASATLPKPMPARPKGILDSLFPGNAPSGPVPGSTGIYQHRDRSVSDTPARAFHAVQAGECRWPLTNFGDPDSADMPCCASPTDGKVYCPTHSSISRGRGSAGERAAARDLAKMARG